LRGGEKSFRRGENEGVLLSSQGGGKLHIGKSQRIVKSRGPFESFSLFTFSTATLKNKGGVVPIEGKNGSNYLKKTDLHGTWCKRGGKYGGNNRLGSQIVNILKGL